LRRPHRSLKVVVIGALHGLLEIKRQALEVRPGKSRRTSTSFTTVLGTTTSSEDLRWCMTTNVWKKMAPYTLHPTSTPYTLVLHPTPYTLHPAPKPCTLLLHPTPYTLNGRQGPEVVDSEGGVEQLGSFLDTRRHKSCVLDPRSRYQTSEFPTTLEFPTKLPTQSVRKQ